jgi:hypothetical protein
MPLTRILGHSSLRLHKPQLLVRFTEPKQFLGKTKRWANWSMPGLIVSILFFLS